MTIVGVAGMLMTAPAGALIDATKRKRKYVVVAVLFITLTSGIILLSQKFWSVSISQVATVIAGSAIGPAIVFRAPGLIRIRGILESGYWWVDGSADRLFIYVLDFHSSLSVCGYYLPIHLKPPVAPKHLPLSKHNSTMIIPSI
ncbi:hypothetical protein [Spirosoma flavus]